MKARPILFSAPMIAALLEDRKTQTRRVVKPQQRADQIMPRDWGKTSIGVRNEDAIYNKDGAWWALTVDGQSHGYRCPYGQPGDLLWVREAVALVGNVDPPWVIYRANGYEAECRRHGFDNPPPESEVRWRPSIHMPRWASRLTLEVNAVRVERVQEINQEDAISEGLKWVPPTYGVPGVAETWNICPHRSFAELWDSINDTKTGYSWACNPLVWVLRFRVIRANVNAVLADPAAYSVAA